MLMTLLGLNDDHPWGDRAIAQIISDPGADVCLRSASIGPGERMNQIAPNGEPITAAGLVALEAEIEDLETTGRREMAARILAARELGDLSENADYHIAKEDQAHLETKIKRLRQRRRDARIVEADVEAAGFGFGRTAEILDEESGATHKWTIVGSTEADLADGKLSAESPVGKALLGCNVGEAVEVQTPRGSRTYRVQRLLS
jgi:transcription elongation factor GreA